MAENDLWITFTDEGGSGSPYPVYIERVSGQVIDDAESTVSGLVTEGLVADAVSSTLLPTTQEGRVD